MEEDRKDGISYEIWLSSRKKGALTATQNSFGRLAIKLTRTVTNFVLEEATFCKGHYS
jgi:hypothetical protein